MRRNTRLQMQSKYRSRPRLTRWERFTKALYLDYFWGVLTMRHGLDGRAYLKTARRQRARSVQPGISSHNSK